MSASFPASEHDSTAINTLRCLAIDMVERANSGHPGAPMGQAALAYVLFKHFLRFDPEAPKWHNRDRFILSCGHASALIYGLLHLGGYDMSLDDLKDFRQWGSKTPGHPEYGHADGVETTTGPLGQGLANGVGIAIGERLLAERFNRPDFDLFDYRTWVLASDGDIMEGVASEASSMAGHLALGKLNVIYDANQITIDGALDLSFSEDVAKRYQAYGWHTLSVADGNDLEELHTAFEAAKNETSRPTLIIVRTNIGFGSPNKQDSSSSHGSPLGEEEVALTKKNYDWPHPPFYVPQEAYDAFAEAAEKGQKERQAWQELRAGYGNKHGAESAELSARESGAIDPAAWQALPKHAFGDAPMATRKASGQVLNAIKEHVPTLAGGSADLTGSNLTYLDGLPDFSKNSPSRNFRFGIREHGMAAALNGMALSGLLRPYGGTFLIFSDYLRPSLRLSALMGLPVIWVFTHDSIFLGEDGPTHQPIAVLPSLRAIPNLVVLRPADGNETAAAWKTALERTDGPSALVLTRQGLPVLERSPEGAIDGVARGGWIVADCGGEPDVILIATGSEVALAVSSHSKLADKNVKARVVSLPSWELFEQQDKSYRDQVLPPSVTRRVGIEAASPFGWERFVGSQGRIIGIDGFGASAPAKVLAQEYGFVEENVLAVVDELLEN